MEKVHIVECLCEKGHYIAGISYFPDPDAPRVNLAHGFYIPRTKAEAILILIRGQKITGGHDHCTVCGSTKVRFEDTPTRFDTMEEAQPVFLKEQRAKTLHNQDLDRAGLTYDSRRRQRN